MPRKFTPKVVTANHLLEGDVIYLTAKGTWSRRLEDAALYTEEAEANERLNFAATQADILVGAYLADAQAGPDGPEPTHFRETFRTRGPSNYAHGKQVEL